MTTAAARNDVFYRVEEGTLNVYYFQRDKTNNGVLVAFAQGDNTPQEFLREKCYDDPLDAWRAYRADIADAARKTLTEFSNLARILDQYRNKLLSADESIATMEKGRKNGN